MTAPASAFADRIQRCRQQCVELFRRIDEGEQVNLEVLRGEPGIGLEPTPWEELRRIVADGSPEALGSLGRDPLVIRRYFAHRDKQSEEFASITDSLLVAIFGVPTTLNEEGKKVAQPPGDFCEDLRIVWMANDFPYLFEEGVEHHNVWANRSLSPEELQQAISKHRQGYEVLHYINPPALQTVPTIWHAHVISRPLSKGGLQRRAAG